MTSLRTWGNFFIIKDNWVLKLRIILQEWRSIFHKLWRLLKRSLPMDTHTRQMGRCTSIFQPTRRSFRMASWKGWRMLKQKSKRRMKRVKRETRRTSRYGRPQSLTNRSGHPPGETADPAGILNVLPWQCPFWARRWTFIQVVSTWFSLIIKTNWHNLRLTTMNLNGRTTFCTWGIYTLRVLRCPKSWRTSSRSRIFWSTAQQEWSNCTSFYTGTTWY